MAGVYKLNKSLTRGSMAGLFDVLNTLSSLVTSAVYPNGTGLPSVTGKQVTIQQGFPIRTQQDIDLLAGYSHVSVYPTSKERVVTKYQRDYQPLTSTPATLTTTVSGQTVTIGGTVSTPQAVILIVNKIGYGYQVQNNDTLNTIAASLAALIPGATATGNVITITGAYSIIGRLSTPYTAGEELCRVDRVFEIIISSPNPTDRATLINAIDVAMKLNYRITLSDGFTGMVFYADTRVDDMLEKQGEYQGILDYTIQYPTTLINIFTGIADPYVNSITATS